MKLDTTTKNAAIAILISLDLLFLALTIAMYLLAATHLPTLKDLADKLWTVFMAANGSVGLALSIERKADSAPTDGSAANPTK